VQARTAVGAGHGAQSRPFATGVIPRGYLRMGAPSSAITC